MAKDKERSVNPAAAQRKAEKQRALKKGKAAVTAQRNERLAQRNPDRLQTQIDELRSRQSENGPLPQREQALLEALERDVNRIRKAKTALGQDQATKPPDGAKWKQDGDGHQVLGKRRRFGDSHTRDPASSDTDDDVRGIPMPRDTPPPIPHRRRDGRRHDGSVSGVTASVQEDKPAPAAQVVYESKPIIRDFRKEATGLVPSAVKRKLDAVRGKQQTLLEEDELDKLEQEGYGAPMIQFRHPVSSEDHEPTVAVETNPQASSLQARVEDVDDED